VDASGYNQQQGYVYNSLSTGRFKDMFDQEKSMTAEEKTLVMRDLQITHEAFIKAVAENRGLDINKVRALADGSSMMGTMALKNGLIDKIGGFNEVEQYLGELVGGEPVICW
jgi:protease-4